MSKAQILNFSKSFVPVCIGGCEVALQKGMRATRNRRPFFLQMAWLNISPPPQTPKWCPSFGPSVLRSQFTAGRKDIVMPILNRNARSVCNLCCLAQREFTNPCPRGVYNREIDSKLRTEQGNRKKRGRLYRIVFMAWLPLF